MTEKQLEQVTRDEILPEYQRAFTEIDDALRNTYLKLLAGVPKTEYYNEMLKYNRYNALLSAIQKSYKEASRRAGILHVAQGKVAISNVFYLRQYALNWVNDGLPALYILPQPLIDLAVLGQPEVWKDLTETLKRRYGSAGSYLPKSGTLSEVLVKNRQADLDRIKTELTQSLVQGKSYTQTASGIKRILNTSSTNAVRIARTEGNRLMNAGAFANAKVAKAEGVNITRVWDAVLDSRTRPDHAALDGKVEDENGLFYLDGSSSQYPSHFGIAKHDINCRCGVVDTVDGISPDVKIGRNPDTGENEIMSYKSFDSWRNEVGLKVNKYGQVYH